MAVCGQARPPEMMQANLTAILRFSGVITCGRDLIPRFGTVSTVSMFVAGKRKLTLKHVKQLSERFRLRADVFLGLEPID